VLEPLWLSYNSRLVLKGDRELAASQYWPEARLLDRQWESTQQLLQYVFIHNRFYRERLQKSGLSPADFKVPADLRKIPVLMKAEVRGYERTMLSDGVVAEDCILAKTGGSTGKPIQVFVPEEASQRRGAAGRRHKQWSGWRLGEPQANIWGNPILPPTLWDKLRHWVLTPSITLDTMSITPESVREFARQWSRVKPTMIFGHAHSVFVLAQMVDELGLTQVRPRAIITSSMMLLPHERAVIERIFGIKVTDMYGCEEVGLIASECERHEGLHLNVEQVLVEILKEDGTPARPGESGVIVVTDLLNRGMPFIRYRMEDMAEVSTQRCSCGRGLPTIRRIVGRTADFLKRRDGSRVAGISLIENTLTRIPGIDQMQIVQEQLLHLQVRIVPGSGFDSAAESELQQYFQQTFPGATIELKPVKGIAQLPNGKYRFSICEVQD
jgi:phenylacetate-CoA ligase